MVSKKRVCNMLVEAGIISVKTLERALELQMGSGKRLGALLRELGIITEAEVLDAFPRHCNLRTVRTLPTDPSRRRCSTLYRSGLHWRATEMEFLRAHGNRKRREQTRFISQESFPEYETEDRFKQIRMTGRVP